MLDLEIIISEIVKYGKEELTTKELLERGLNNYYIKKAVDKGELEKIDRGKYKVVNVIKSKQRDYLFKKFIGYVFSNDFEKAYDALLSNLECQINHNYDNHLRTYFILLSKILGRSEDEFKKTDLLLEFSEKSGPNFSYYQHFINFRQAVESSNFEQAFVEISKYKYLENERNSYNRISTKLFLHLTGTIVYKNSNLTQNKERVTEINKSQKRVNDKMYQSIYEQFLMEYKNENYEMAIQKLKEALTYSTLNNKDILNNLIRLLNVYLRISKENIILKEKGVDYTSLGDNYLLILKKALDNQDYLVAFKNIGKCIYFDNNNTLSLYKELLHKIIDQNKNNIFNHQSNNEDKKKNEFKDGVSEKVIFQLIYDRKYDQITQLLDDYLKFGNSCRLYGYLFKMINDMNDIHNLKKVYDDKVYSYRNGKEFCFKRFFEALKYGDYLEAYQCVIVCEEIVDKRNFDDLEFKIYKYIIEDILNEIDVAREKSERLQRVHEIQEKIDDYIFEKILYAEEILNLEKLLLDKIDMAADIEDVVYDEYTLQLIDVFKASKERHLDSSYFGNVCDHDRDIVVNFFEAMKIGDYVTAKNIIMSNKWLEQTKKFNNKKYFILYKKLFSRINKIWTVNSGVTSNSCKLVGDYSVDTSRLTHLGILKTLVKKRNYVGAYQYYQENLRESFDLELRGYLDILLKFTNNIQTKEMDEIYHLYREAYSKGDFGKARDFLKQYDECVKQSGLNRNVDYHYARVNSLSLEVETSSFVEKEQLYDYAKYCLENGNYKECIEIMNKYILLDQDLSAKGYLLRGRAYEFLKQYSLAKEDYQKSIAIIPEPNAFYRLGRLCVFQENYLEGEKNFLEFEKRRPNRNINNIIALKEIYQLLGDEDNYYKYENLSEKLLLEKRLVMAKKK